MRGELVDGFGSDCGRSTSVREGVGEGRNTIPKDGLVLCPT